MDEIFKRRHSVRDFLRRKIKPEKLNEILDAADSASSAGNLKARKIIVVENPDIKKKLMEAAFNQGFILDAPVVLVFFALPSVSSRKYGKRGENLYAIQDATIAASFAWIQAVMLGLGACWVGGFSGEKVKKLLRAEKNWHPVVIMPMGYSSE